MRQNLIVGAALLLLAGDEMMAMPVAPLLAGVHIQIAASGAPPTVDIEETCRASEREIIKLFGDTTAVTVDACMKQESDAFEQIKTGWATYQESEKSHCVQSRV